MENGWKQHSMRRWNQYLWIGSSKNKFL